MTYPVEASIQNKLTDELEPSHLEIINESYMHNVPKGSETHFKVVVVTEKFNGLPLLKVRSIFHIKDTKINKNSQSSTYFRCSSKMFYKSQISGVHISLYCT